MPRNSVVCCYSGTSFIFIFVQMLSIFRCSCSHNFRSRLTKNSVLFLLCRFRCSQLFSSTLFSDRNSIFGAKLLFQFYFFLLKRFKLFDFVYLSISFTRYFYLHTQDYLNCVSSPEYTSDYRSRSNQTELVAIGASAIFRGCGK